MTTRKTERILNLTICLLVSDRYLPKSRIREAVEGYHDLSDAAFERTFERDKDELRGARGADRGRQLRRLLRRRAGLPDPAQRVRAAADRPGRGGGLGGRGRRPGLAARQHGRVDDERAGQAAGGRGRAGHLPAGRAGAVGAGHRAGLRAAVDRRAGPGPGQLHLPGRRPAHPGAVGADRVQGPLVRDRLGHGPRRPPGCSSSSRIADLPRTGLPGRRVRGAGRPRPAGPGPLAGAAGADRDRPAGHPHRPGAGPGPARRAGEQPDAPLPERLRGVRGGVRRPVVAGRGDQPARAPTWWCWSRPSCGTRSSAAWPRSPRRVGPRDLPGPGPPAAQPGALPARARRRGRWPRWRRRSGSPWRRCART